GLLNWNQNRLEWLGSLNARNRRKIKEPPLLSWSRSYEHLVSTSSPFLTPVPLSEMVDFLVDVWDQEGLYD
ncbi:hypothetical protein M569_09789, partial [Genlisea aurea]